MPWNQEDVKLSQDQIIRDYALHRAISLYCDESKIAVSDVMAAAAIFASYIESGKIPPPKNKVLKLVKNKTEDDKRGKA